MRSRVVSGDPSTADFAMFSKWQEGCASLFDAFDSFQPKIAPFQGNETSCVSVLVAAAGRAGFTPIAEAITKKHARTADGLLKDYNGRSDLMMMADRLQYAFEFKISWPNSCNDQLELSLKLAMADMNCVHRDENYRRFAGIVAPFSNGEALARYETFQPDRPDLYAFQVSDSARRSGAFFIFQQCQGK